MVRSEIVVKIKSSLSSVNRIRIIFIVLIVIMLMSSCTNELSKNPEKWDKSDLVNWFELKEWKSGIEIDELVDKKGNGSAIFQ